MMTSLRHHLANLHKFLYSFEKTIGSYLYMPNFKSISFKLVVLQGGGQNLPPCVCYPKGPMWNRVKEQGVAGNNPLLLSVNLSVKMVEPSDGELEELSDYSSHFFSDYDLSNFSIQHQLYLFFL